MKQRGISHLLERATERMSSIMVKRRELGTISESRIYDDRRLQS